MTELKPNPPEHMTDTPGDDPLARLHKMSTTAGLGTTDYVAVNGFSIATLILGAASPLSLFANELLVIPALAVIFGIVSIIKINDSNGTQTGKPLAWVGMVLAVGFVGLVGGRLVLQTFSNRSDEQAIEKVITTFNQNLVDKKFDAAYAQFTIKFTTRVKKQQFTDLWKQVTQSKENPNIHSNGQMAFDTQPDGSRVALGMTIMQFAPNAPEQRIEMIFRKNAEGAWMIEDIPTIFPTEQPGAPKMGR